ncbi:MAG: LPS assembly lipoprotein LptE [Pseudomonadota bacterium]
MKRQPPPTTRRTFLLGGLAFALTPVLPGCGFQPRGTLALPAAMRKISLQGSQPSGLTDALTRLLQSNGAQILSGAPLPADAISIRLSDIRIQRREALTDRQANIRLIELLQRVQLDAQHADGRPLIRSESFEAVRSASYNPLSLLAQGEEEERLRRELDEQLAHTLLARLKSVMAHGVDTTQP